MTRFLWLTFVGLFYLQLILTSVAADWRRFRGANGSGISQAHRLPVDFGPTKNISYT